MSSKTLYLVFLCSLALFERQVVGPLFPPKRIIIVGDPCADDESENTATSYFHPVDEPSSSSSSPSSSPDENIKAIANQYFFDGMFDEAIRCYNKAIKMNPNVPKYYRNRGFAYTRSNMSDLAVADYRKALELEPRSVRGLVYLSRELIQVNQVNEAMEQIEMALTYGQQSNPPISDQVEYQIKKIREKIRAEHRAQQKWLFNYFKNLIIKDAEREIDQASSQERVKALKTSRDEYIKELVSFFPGVDDEQQALLAQDVPEYLCDRINLQIMKDPVLTPDGITYERTQIMKHLEVTSTDPSSRSPLEPEQLRPNKSLKEAIDDYMEKSGLVYE